MLAPGKHTPPLTLAVSILIELSVGAPLLQRHLQHARVVRMAHLGVVEDRDAERVLLLHVVELHVELAVGDELPGDHERPYAILPDVLGRDVAPVALKGATMMAGTSSLALYFALSNGTLSGSRIQYGGPGLLPDSANFGPFLSSLTLFVYPPPVFGSLLRPASGALSLSYRVPSMYWSSTCPTDPVRTLFQCQLSRSSPGLGVYMLPYGLPSSVWQAAIQPFFEGGRTDVPEIETLSS